MLSLNWCPIQGNLKLSKDIGGNSGITSAKTSQLWVEFTWHFSKLLLNGASNAIITLFCCNAASVLTITSSSTCFCFSCMLCIVSAHWSRKTQPPRYHNHCKLSVPEFHNGGTFHLISASALIIVYYFFIQMGLRNHKIKFQMQGLLCGSKYLSTKSEFTVVLRVLKANCSPWCMVYFWFWFGRLLAFWVVLTSPNPLATEWTFLPQQLAISPFFEVVIQPLSLFSFAQKLYSRETFGGS